MNKFAFIILNYNTETQTLTCINEILNHTKNITEKKIFVLDNGSNNTRLRDNVACQFSDTPDISFFYSDKNLGFANGNNYLYKKCKECFEADFYVFINNDVYLVSNDFCEQIIQEYDVSNFSVLGPRIILGNNTIDSCPFESPSLKTVKKELKYWKTVSLLSKIRLAVPYVYFKIAKELICKYLHLSGYERLDKSHRKENVLLHGACLILSKQYFSNYEEPFNPNTFLYKEEELLLQRCLKQNLLTVFLPSLIVYHEGGVSTIKNRNKNQLFKFRAKHYIDSLTILQKELEKMVEDTKQ